MPSNRKGRLPAASALLFIICIIAGSCGDLLLDVEFENDPVGNFDALWSEFDRYYALFGVRSVDWDSLYCVYRPIVNSASTEAVTFEAMTGLLSHLEDRHVRLYAAGFTRYQSGYDQGRYLFSDSDPDSFSSDRDAMIVNVIREYLDSVYVDAEIYDLPEGFSLYGTISAERTALRLGYILVRTFFFTDPPDSYYSAIVKAFDGYDGVIIDLRVNGGGSMAVSSGLINRFADRERAYCRSMYRNGPDHGDFTEPETYYLDPAEGALGNVPVAVLTTRYTASASEMFILGTRVLPTFTVLGDTTCGVFGGITKKVLPNGWEFTLSPELCVAIDGTCFEGKGIPPDIYILASRLEVDAGTDAAVESAIEVLEAAAR